jgi:hypothetical protein
MISGKVAKTALVVLLGRNLDLFQPQINRSNPVSVEGFLRHL